MHLQNPFSRCIALWAAFLLPFHAARADKNQEPLNEVERSYNRAGEFFSEEVPGEVLISVHLIGAVSHPGVYHVPRNTDLVHLISLAGGTRDDANLQRISIKRTNKAAEEVIEANLRELASEPGKRPPLLQAGDLVLVYVKDPLVDQSTVTFISLVTSLLSILVSATLLIRATK